MAHSHARACLVPLTFAALALASAAQAAVPAAYTGRPYMGTPQAIPGRVELANLDEGGLNVAFFADHRRENAVAEGYAPISGDDWRPGNLALPNICKTNRASELPGEGSEDFWEDGTRYPSDAMPYTYYMGYAHTVDWVRVTVSVKQPGKYNVSSSWACANTPCGLSIWFNDGSGKSDDANHPLDGVNKTGEVKFDATNDYHKWRKYPNFTQVDLSAGDQLMTFHVAVNNHLQYGYLVFDPVDGVTQGGAGGIGNGGGAGVAGSTSVGSAGTDGSGGAPSAAGTPTVGTSGAAGTVTNTSGGTAPSTAGAADTSTRGGVVTGANDTNTASGCALSSTANSRRSSGVAGLLLVGYMLRRRCPRKTASVSALFIEDEP